jgi:hypothetical protein
VSDWFEPTWIGPILGVLVGYSLHRLEALVVGPRLCVEFLQDRKHVADGRTIPGSLWSRWGRVSIRSTRKKVAEGCRAYLVNVHREEAGQWKRTPFIDPMLLPWATTPESEQWEARDIPKGVRFYADVVTAVQLSEGLDTGRLEACSQFRLRSSRLDDLFHNPGRYRLGIVVTAHGVKPRSIALIVNWTGRWQLDLVRDATRNPRLE